MNPIVYCTKHAEQFEHDYTETDSDGTQLLVKQYWKAKCGCEVEITVAFELPKGNA